MFKVVLISKSICISTYKSYFGLEWAPLIVQRLAGETSKLSWLSSILIRYFMHTAMSKKLSKLDYYFIAKERKQIHHSLIMKKLITSKI